MSRVAVEMLVDRWLEEPAFRGAVRANPEAAIRASGAELDDEEWAAVRGWDWSLSDEDIELQLREDKWGCA